MFWYKKIVNIYELRDKLANKLTDNLQIWHINIENCYNIWYSNNINKYEKEKQYLILLGALLCTKNKIEFSKCLGGIPMNEDIKDEIKETNDALNVYEDIMSWYDYDKDQENIRKSEINRAEKKGIEQGLKQGIQKEKLESAKKMKKKNIDLNTISEITGLSIDEIKKL